MADYSKDEFVELIKRVGAFITFKISNLFNNFDTRSAGTIAGLAFALVFTWRLLRSPRAPPRIQPKRQASTSHNSDATGTSNADIVSPGVSTSGEDSRAQNVIDQFFQPVKPTLGQILRQRLSEGRKVTCQLLGVILEETTPEEIQEKATVRSSVLEILLEITKFCDLYLMERVLDDESETGGFRTSGGSLCLLWVPISRSPEKVTLCYYIIMSIFRAKKRVLQALQDAGIFSSGVLVKDKVLFCSTDVGRTSFVRQLEPDWHIDTNVEIVSQLARFIRYQLHISPTKPERSAPNVFTSTSLELFFGCI